MMTESERKHSKEWLQKGLPEGWKYNADSGFLFVEGAKIAYWSGNNSFNVWAGTPEENKACADRLEEMRQAYVAAKVAEHRRKDEKAVVMVRLVGARLTPADVRARLAAQRAAKDGARPVFPEQWGDPDEWLGRLAKASIVDGPAEYGPDGERVDTGDDLEWKEIYSRPAAVFAPVDGAWKYDGPPFAGHGDDSLVSNPVGKPSEPDHPPPLAVSQIAAIGASLGLQAMEEKTIATTRQRWAASEGPNRQQVERDASEKLRRLNAGK